MTTQPTKPATPTTTDHADTGRLASAVRVVSGFTLLSRFAGLARDILTARIFGDDALGSAFRAAYAVPNLFRRLFGEGALSAAFLPEYVILTRDDPDTAGQLARLMVRFVSLATGALTLLIGAALILLLLLLPADAERAMSFRLMLLMLPMMPAVCLTAILGGMLQAHGRFGLPAAAPILLNLFQIAAGALFFAGAVTDRTAMAFWIGGAALLASAAQVAWSLWALKGQVRWARAGDAAKQASRTVLDRFVPAMLGLGTLQLNTTLDMVIAMWPIWVGPMVFGFAVPLDDKSNAVLSYTHTNNHLPHGVFGIAVATAIFPLLSRSADKPAEFAANLRRGLRLSLFIGLPASLGLVLVRHDLVAVIFGGGTRHAFTGEGLARSASVLLAFAPAVWAYSLNHVYTRAFYARGDTKTPMRVAIAMVLLNLSLNLTLVWFLREAGLAWATSITAIVQCIVLARLCHTRLNVTVFDPDTITAFVRITLITLAMGAATWLVSLALPPATAWFAHLQSLALAVVLGGVVYLACARLFKMPELTWLLQRPPKGDSSGPMGLD